jgi:hypothetical protein
MNALLEKLYQEIGQEALQAANDLSGKLLIYAEVSDGVISADMFYVNNPSGSVRFRFCPRPLRNLILQLWEGWQKILGNKEWRVLCYVIDNGNFIIDLLYPNQVKNDEDVSDRRSLAVIKYFGNEKVDYSQP